MPSAAFFRALGLFIRPSFFDVDTCHQVIEAICSAPSATPARVDSGPGIDEMLDEKVRRTRVVHVADTVRQSIAARLQAVMPEVADHFDVNLVEIQKPQFLVYRPGDFFTTHRDRDPEGANRRIVSIIAFLNSGKSEFSGGNVKFYGVVGGKPHPFSFQPEEGLLLAFDSEMFHEVEMVTSGKRYTIVSWFA